jgi:hypothetical protein
MTNHVMLDIETLGAEKPAPVLSIGAVLFDESGPSQHGNERFYTAIDPESLAEEGFVACPDTAAWWMQQSDPARHAAVQGDVTVRRAFRRFRSWYRGVRETVLWANPPTFDHVVLRGAYEHIDYDAPWHPAEARCCRTLDKLVPIEHPDREGTHHNALDDAIHQARVAGQQLAILEEAL